MPTIEFLFASILWVYFHQWLSLLRFKIEKFACCHIISRKMFLWRYYVNIHVRYAKLEKKSDVSTFKNCLQTLIMCIVINSMTHAWYLLRKKIGVYKLRHVNRTFKPLTNRAWIAIVLNHFYNNYCI